MRVRFTLCVGLLLAVTATIVRAETTVTLKETHLCCPACVTAVEKALAKVEGATAECDREKKSITVKAADDATAKKALGAIARAGFYGTSDHKELKIAPGLRAIPKGNVSRLELARVHNCCGACTKAIKSALASVKGVQGDTVKAKETTFVVEGDFNPRAVIQALNKAGFHAGPKRDKADKAKGKKKQAQKAKDAQ